MKPEKTSPGTLPSPWYFRITKRWLWRLAGFLAWFLFLRGTFGVFRSVPYSSWIDIFFSQQFAPQRYGIYLCILLLIILTRKLWYTRIWSSIGLVLYMFFFPIVLVALVFSYGFRVLGLTFSSLNGILGAFSSKKFLVASILAWPLCTYILFTETGNLLVPSMVLLGLITFRLLIEIFLLGAQPLTLVDKIVRWCVGEYQKVVAHKRTTTEKLRQLKEEDFLREARKQRGEIVNQRKLKKFLLDYAKKRGTPYLATLAFICCFGGAFLLAAIAFAIEFKALLTISPNSLHGIPGTDFLDFLFLSVMWLSTSSPEGVVAVSSSARLLVAAETLTGIALLVFLIQCFSLILGHDLEEGKAFVKQLVDETQKNIAERQAVLIVPDIVQQYTKLRRKRRT